MYCSLLLFNLQSRYSLNSWADVSYLLSFEKYEVCDLTEVCDLDLIFPSHIKVRVLEISPRKAY